MSQQPKPPVALSKPDPYHRLPRRSVHHTFICMSRVRSNLFRFKFQTLYFTAYALHRTKLHSSVTFAALVLLQHLKAHFTTARGSSSHHLFLSAFMIASKVICNDTYPNKSWSIVGQGVFWLHKINQMEHVMCQYLNSELNVELGRVVVGRKCVDKELR